MFGELVSFKDHFGDCRVLHEYEESRELFTLLQSQRREFQFLQEGKRARSQPLMTEERLLTL
jgi:hypothetical protein